MEDFMSKITFEEFKKKNEKYYKEMFEKNKKEFNTKALYLNGKELTIEDAMLKAYKTECKYDQSESSSQKKAS
jgi:hypothetical protein